MDAFGFSRVRSLRLYIVHGMPLVSVGLEVYVYT